MKDRLEELISQINAIESHFAQQKKGALPTIYSSSEFIEWQQALLLELQEIYDRMQDPYIGGTIDLLSNGFNGWRDKPSFYTLSGKLRAIQNNIGTYYPAGFLRQSSTSNAGDSQTKITRIFISHSSKDEKYVLTLANLLFAIGLKPEDIICSSVSGCSIPLNEDIYEFLRQQFQKQSLHVLFILSDNYYNSPASLNEMGAAWVVQACYTSILLPGFTFESIRGAINPRKIAIKLDSSEYDLKEKLGQLKDNLIKEFQLPALQSIHWERIRDEFIAKITSGK